MKNAFLTLALASAMLVGGMAWTNTSEARPRAWRYYGGPARYYGGYYGNFYPRYYGQYYAPRYYSGPPYYSYPYRYSYGYPRAGLYWRF